MQKSIFIMILITFFIVSCSNTRWHEKIVFKNKDSKVSLESKEKNKKIVNNIYAHPAVIKENLLNMFLKSIYYFEETGLFSEKKKAFVFKDYEIKRLVKNIKEGLQKADSSQRIHFVSFNRGEGGIFDHLRKTEGIVFIKPSGKINIAFLLVNHEIRLHVNNDSLEMDEKINPLKTRDSGTPVFSTLFEVKKHEFKDGGKSPAWLVADINGLENMLVEKTKIREKKSVAIEKINKEQDNWSREKEKIKVRLKYIKELFSQELISKDDYEAKKKELLKQIK